MAIEATLFRCIHHANQGGFTIREIPNETYHYLERLI
jgi:hypothetical protein